MTAPRWGVGLIAFLVLTGCSPEMPDAPPLGMVLDANGAHAASSPVRADFGMPEQEAVDAVTRLIGEYPYKRKRLWFCGVAVDWAIGYRMVFVDGKFAGWTAVPGRFDAAGGTFETGDKGRLTAGKTC